MDSGNKINKKESFFGTYDNAPNVSFQKMEEDDKIDLEENFDSTRTHLLSQNELVMNGYSMDRLERREELQR